MTSSPVASSGADGGLLGDVDLAAIGAALADPGRCRVLLALLDGRALPASRLAAEAGVAASTATHHLSRLVDAGLLSAESHGRFRYYRLAGPEVGELLEALTRLSPPRPVRSLREGSRAAALRRARTCYDHLAGQLGVAVLRVLLDRGLLTGIGPDGTPTDGGFDPQAARRDRLSARGCDVDYSLTTAGHAFLEELGVRLPARPSVRYCVDWSEQRHHLAGAPGRALLDRLLDLRWLRRAERSRAVHVTPEGRIGLRETFGLDWPAR